MLEFAHPYKEKLEKIFLKTVHNESFKYYNCDCYHNFNMGLSDSTWDAMQFVSVDKSDNVIGFLSAKIDRADDMIGSLSVINFYGLNYTFSKDFYQFLSDLFIKFKFRKIVFSVVVGNPAEKMYDKYIEKYNGRIVGVKKKEVKLYDNEYYDQKFYEIFREDYLKARGEVK